MPELLADVNAGGHLAAVIAACESEPWREFWAELGVAVRTFDDLGLHVTTGDDVLWRFCQDHDVLLVTGNRNHQGVDSLEATILARNSLEALPVLTLADPDRLIREREYAERAAIRLIDILMNLDANRGTGRLWLP